MAPPNDTSRTKRWWPGVWPRATVIHPLLAVPILIVVLWLTRHDADSSTPPVIAAIQIAAGGSGAILTLAMVARRPALGINERLVLVVAGAFANAFVLYGAYIVALLLGANNND